MPTIKPTNQIAANQEKAAKGQGMVEFAIAFPIFLAIVMGVIEFGYLLYFYSTVYSATREAARYGSSVGINPSTNKSHEKDCVGIRQAATRIGGMIGVTNTTINIRYDSGPTDTRSWDQLPTCESNPDTQLGDRVVVRVSLTFKPLIGVLPNIPIQYADTRSIIKNVDVSGNFPTAPPFIYTSTPLPTPTNTGTPTQTPLPTNTETPTPTSLYTATESSTPTITETPSLTPTATVTLTPSITPLPSATPTATITRTPTATATPDPCDQLAWSPPVWDSSSLKYYFDIINNSRTTTVYLRSLTLSWSSPNSNSVLSYISMGHELWSGTGYSTFVIGDSNSGAPNLWKNGSQSKVDLKPNTVNPLTMIFSGPISMNWTWVTIQVGDNPNFICVFKPPVANNP